MHIRKMHTLLFPYVYVGNKIVSVGSDKKIQLYDGATGNPTTEIPDAHAGGIYHVCFSPDGKAYHFYCYVTYTSLH